MEEKWTKIIKKDNKGMGIDIKSVYEYKDLIWLFVKRDFIIYYKQTILGPMWYLIQPILSTLIYIVLFGNLAKLSTDSIPQVLFYFGGTMMWTYFSGCLIDISNVFFSNKAIFGKVFFPRIIVPISTMISLLVKLLVQLLFFIFIYIVYYCIGVDIGLSWRIILFPAVVLWIGLLGCALGMIVSSITTKYRDIAMALGFLISLFMYATPVVYPLSQTTGDMRFLLCLNPVSAPMEIFRYSWFSTSIIEQWAIIYSVTVTVILLLVGTKMFSINEKSFIDVI